MTDQISSHRRSAAGRVAAAIAILVALAILLSLGTWQVQRLAWKESLIAAIAERRVAPPVSVAGIESTLSAGGDIEYRTVTAEGAFDHAKERHFLATHEGQSGFYVYTPLTLGDGRALFVNRGFVPYDRKDAATRAEGQVEGPVTVGGLARNRLEGKPSSLVPDNDPAKNVFYWKDLDAFAASTGIGKAQVVPFFIDADAKPNPGGLPVGAVTQIDLPNSHLQYAITWYGLALALALVSGFYLFRRKP